MKKFFILGIVFISFLLVGIVQAQYTKDPQILWFQKSVNQQMEKSGFADARIDSLHKKIKTALPTLQSFINNDDGESKISILVANGETMEFPQKLFLYSVYVDLFTNAEASSLDKIKMRFVKIEVSDKFNTEVRIIENPTPQFSEDLETLNRNDDLILSYYELALDPNQNETVQFPEHPNEKFSLLKSLSFSDISDFDKKMLLVNAYTEYLAKLEQQVSDKEASVKLTEAALFRKIMTLD